MERARFVEEFNSVRDGVHAYHRCLLQWTARTKRRKRYTLKELYLQTAAWLPEGRCGNTDLEPRSCWHTDLGHKGGQVARRQCQAGYRRATGCWHRWREPCSWLFRDGHGRRGGGNSATVGG